MTVPALLLAALIAGPVPAPRPAAADPAADAVLAEMAPAPGRWEIEDAPAYFSDRARPADEAGDIPALFAADSPVAAVMPQPRPETAIALPGHQGP